jgi:hypothetical protein
VTQITHLKRAMEKALLIDAVGRNFVLDVTSYLDGMWSQSLKPAGQLKAGYEQAGGLDQLTSLPVVQLENLTMLLKFHWSTTFEFGERRNWLTLDAFERKRAPICRKMDGLDTDGNYSGVAEALCAVQLTLGVFTSAEFLGYLAAFIATLRGGARRFQHVKADHLLLRVHGGLAKIMGCIRSCPDLQGLPLQMPAECATAVTHGFGQITEQLADPDWTEKDYKRIKDTKLPSVLRANNNAPTIKKQASSNPVTLIPPIERGRPDQGRDRGRGNDNYSRGGSLAGRRSAGQG